MLEKIKIPKWNNMPEPKEIITLSWEDIFFTFIEKGITPTKQQVTNAFEEASKTLVDDRMMAIFWHQCEMARDEVL